MGKSDQNWIEAILAWLQLSTTESNGETITTAIAHVPAVELESLLGVLAASGERTQLNIPRLRIVMQAIAARSVQHAAANPAETADDAPWLDPDLLTELYERLDKIDAQSAAHCLQALTAQYDEESVGAVASIVAFSPPSDWQTLAVALSPLWNATGEVLEFFFDRLDEGLMQPAAMAVLLDLANYAHRTAKLSEHPFLQRAEELTRLLTAVVARLRQLEKEPSKFGEDVPTVQRILSESVALLIALCDTLGFVGKAFAQEPLRDCLQLSHRRVQTEAAAALARMGDSEGQRHLVRLAADVVARFRAVAYAEELGLAEQIDEPMRLPVAMAESELANWLANPEQYGLPPATLELIDSRTMYWPGYEEPRNCYLFRYCYSLPNMQLENVGIVGPVVHAFAAKLDDFSVDDIYAVFAGWHAEHEGIYEVPGALLNAAQRTQADQLMEVFASRDAVVEQPLALTFLLGEISLLAQVTQSGVSAYAITDGRDFVSLPIGRGPASITPEIVVALYRGRKLLRSFNP